MTQRDFDSAVFTLARLMSDALPAKMKKHKGGGAQLHLDITDAFKRLCDEVVERAERAAYTAAMRAIKDAKDS